VEESSRREGHIGSVASSQRRRIPPTRPYPRPKSPKPTLCCRGLTHPTPWRPMGPRRPLRSPTCWQPC
jgi:hypothetical protein